MEGSDRLAALKPVILGAFPELARSKFSLSLRGWDSLAVDVDDRLIFKFPRHAAAEERLRKEARVLAHIRARVALPVPDMTLFESPVVFSRHPKLPGTYLDPPAYAALSEPGRARIARQLAGFYAELHALDRAELAALKVGPIGPWLEPERILASAAGLLPKALGERACAAVRAFADLPPDPHGTTYGFFDGHGWNMAFDADQEDLNGVYDFGDSGFGCLHQEFIYTSLVSFDLTERVVASYETITGRLLDRERIHLLSGVHALSELAELAIAGAPAGSLQSGIARVAGWAAARPA